MNVSLEPTITVQQIPFTYNFTIFFYISKDLLFLLGKKYMHQRLRNLCCNDFFKCELTTILIFLQLIIRCEFRVLITKDKLVLNPVKWNSASNVQQKCRVARDTHLKASASSLSSARSNNVAPPTRPHRTSALPFRTRRRPKSKRSISRIRPDRCAGRSTKMAYPHRRICRRIAGYRLAPWPDAGRSPNSRTAPASNQGD